MTADKQARYKVFTYGTLRPMKGGNYKTADAALEGYKMYNYGNRFPYILPDENGTIRGNVVEVNDTELKRLDVYEGLETGLYKREEVKVFWEKEGWITAYVYVGNNIADQVVESGDWSDVA